MAYNKTTWIDDVTPLNAENLNNIEDGIENMYKATVNGKVLSNNPSLTAADVGALPNSTKIPIIDKKFSSTSENAQSGLAVAQAVTIEQNRADNTFSNALKGSKSGSAILIDDVSPVSHDIGVKIRGKNLCDDTKRLFTGGAIFFGFTQSIIPIKLSKGTYTFSVVTADGTTTNLYIKNSDNTKTLFAAYSRNKLTFTLSETQDILLSVYKSGYTSTDDVVTAQLELGTTATAYTPYVPDLTAVKVSRYGKNLFDKNNANIIVGYPDAENVINSASTTKSVYIPCAPNMTYTVSKVVTSRFAVAFTDVLPASGVAVTGRVQNNTATSITSASSANSRYIVVWIYHSNYDTSITVDEVLATLQIEQGSTATEYEPYKTSTEYSSTADGTVNGVTSLYPNTTLTTDTKGVLIDCEYNRDINKFSGVDVDLTGYVKNTDINQSYDPLSTNAQSGKAVEQAVSTIFKQSKAQYGDELISADGWTLDGWTGNLENGFAHTVGKTGILTFSLGNTGTNIYCLEFDVTSPTAAGSPNASTAFTVTIGNSPRFITYDGGGSKHYCFGIKSVENGDLKFIPTDTSDPNTDGSTFDGTISNISLKQIISYNEPSTFLKDSGSNVNILEEKRFLYDSVYVGKNSGQLAIQGSQLNFAFGNDALRNNTTGYWNTAIGSTALRDNTVGSRNVAIGKMALEQNSSGDRNIGIGSFSLCRNINGRNNIGIGADSLWNNISGNGNIGIGLAALGENKTGSFNVCIGYNAMPKNTSGDQNIAIGYAAMNDATTGKGNIGIGYWALRKNQANYNIAIGSSCLLKNTTGSVNIAIGQSALESNVVGNSNVAIGHNSGKVTTGSQSVFIGAACGERVTGDQNTLIGYNVAKSLAGGTLNTIIGGKADAAAGVFNTVVIGYNASATKSNQAVIGNDNISETLLKGNLIVRGIDGTKRKILFNTDGSITWSEVA